MSVPITQKELEIWTKDIKDYSIKELEDWHNRKEEELHPLWRKMVEKEYKKRKKTAKEQVIFT